MSVKNPIVLRILVAASDEENATITTAFLENMGHQVRRAVNGADTVNIYTEGWPEIVLMDVHMSELDGLETTRKIRAMEKKSKRLPIIGLTEEGFSGRHANLIQAGMDDVITKPFSQAQLVDALDTYSHQAAADDFGFGVQAQADQYPESEELEVIGNSNKLLKLGSQMGEEILQSLLKQAIQSLEELAGELEQAVSREDSDQIFRTAHSIKGSCGSLFALKISHIATNIEANAKDQSFIVNSLPEFKNAVQETNDWWKSHLTTIKENS